MEWEVTECRDMSEGRVTECTWRNGGMVKDLMEGSERNSKKRKRNKMGKWRKRSTQVTTREWSIQRRTLVARRRTNAGKENLIRKQRIQRAERKKKEWKEKWKESERRKLCQRSRMELEQ